MSAESAEIEKPPVGRLFIPSLIMSAFAASVSGGILGILTRDIAIEFNVPVAVAGQLATINSLAEFAVAFLIGFLAIRFKHKTLLLGGVLIVAFSAIGGFFSPNLFFMLFFFALEGIGSVIVSVMGTTLIGDSLPLKQKAKAISYMATAVAATTIAGALTIGLVADFAGWRSIFLVYTLPASVLALVAAHRGLPSIAPEESCYTGARCYKTAFKHVFSSKSAAFCLIAGFLLSTTGLRVYTGTFFQEVFGMPRSLYSIVFSTIAATAMVAYIVGGRLVNSVGRKNLTVATILAGSITEMLVFLMPEMWTAVAMDLAHVFVSWIGAIAITSYVLEQIPQSRSTMMSVRSVVSSLGEVVAPILGGALLLLFAYNLLFSYQVAGFVFGSIGIVASVIFFFQTKDSTIIQKEAIT